MHGLSDHALGSLDWEKDVLRSCRRAGDYLVWCTCFLVVWFLMTFGLRGLLIAIEYRLGDEEQPWNTAQEAWEAHFGFFFFFGLPGAAMGGLFAPRALREPGRRLWILTYSSLSTIALALAIFLIRTGVPIPLDSQYFFLAIGVMWAMWYGAPAALVTFIGCWGANLAYGLFLARPDRFRARAAAGVVLGAAAYCFSYAALRADGKIGFQWHYGMVGFRPSDVPNVLHIETGSRWMNWLYWFPGEIEVNFLGTTVPRPGPDMGWRY